jgi:hypothetical protein
MRDGRYGTQQRRGFDRHDVFRVRRFVHAPQSEDARPDGVRKRMCAGALP